jgi:hypothetical protein
LSTSFTEQLEKSYRVVYEGKRGAGDVDGAQLREKAKTESKRDYLYPQSVGTVEANYLGNVTSSMMGMVASRQDVGPTDDRRDELRQTLTDELMETGLCEDNEPNERGLLLLKSALASSECS